MIRPPSLRRLPVWFDAPVHPPPHDRIRIDPDAGPVRLGFAIIRSAGWHVVGGSSLLIGFHATNVLIPVVLGAAIDDGIGAFTGGTVTRAAVLGLLGWLALIAVLYCITNLTFRFGGRIGWYGVQRAQFELSDRVLARALSPQGAAGAPPLPGNLLALATLDAQRACLALYVAIYPIGEGVAVAVGAVSLTLIHPGLGIGVLIAAPILLAGMSFAARPLHRSSIGEQSTAASATAAAADIVAGRRVLAGIHAQSHAAARYRDISRTALDSTLRARSAQSAFDGLNTATSGLFAATLTITAAILAVNGTISIGGFIAAAGVAQSIMAPLQAIVGQAHRLWAIAMASGGRILAFLRTGDAADASGAGLVDASSGPAKPLLRVEDAPLESAPFSTTVHAGEFVVIDLQPGDAAALTEALALAQPDHASPRLSAHIRVFGDRIVDLDPTAVRRTILVAPHEAALFGGTVSANVAAAIPETEQAECADAVAHALDAAGGERFADELPNGYATQVGEGGRSLSGGQRQRVALARAIAADPPVLVLHDPLNAVDAVTEDAIARRIHDIRAGRTTIVVTSSPAFRAAADRVIATDRVAPADPVVSAHRGAAGHRIAEAGEDRA